MGGLESSLSELVSAPLRPRRYSIHQARPDHSSRSAGCLSTRVALADSPLVLRLLPPIAPPFALVVPTVELMLPTKALRNGIVVDVSEVGKAYLVLQWPH
jgi:hypothetical protein